jgi:uncharacterized protein (TIGR02246 family)
MAGDVVFLVPGQELFGKEAFAASAKEMKNVSIEGTSDVQELNIAGKWAWMRNRLKVTITPSNGRSVHHSGTLTILRKNPDDGWVIARDANLPLRLLHPLR